MRKNNVPQFTSHSVRDRFLEHASPELVYTIFEKEQVEDGETFYRSRFSPEIETKLLGRQEPIIDLALASFSCSVDILRKLFLKNDDVLTAALSGNKNARAAASSSYEKSPNFDFYISKPTF